MRSTRSKLGKREQMQPSTPTDVSNVLFLDFDVGVEWVLFLGDRTTQVARCVAEDRHRLHLARSRILDRPERLPHETRLKRGRDLVCGSVETERPGD